MIHRQGTAAIDWRTAPGYSRIGGYYGVTFHDFNDRDKTFSFRRMDGELIQHVPLLRETWVLSFRGRVQSTIGDDDRVPYYLLPYLGSGTTLRGYPTGQFRDRHALLTSAEFRWIASRVGLDMAIFYDAGKVANRREDLDFSNLKSDWGVGLRFHGPTVTPLRIEAAKAKRGLAPDHFQQRRILIPGQHIIMRTAYTSPRRALAIAGLCAAIFVSGTMPGAQSRPKFLSDDPLTREPDTQDASKTQEWEIGLTADLTLNLFGKPGDPTTNVRAQNANTIDEVPDSSWFTNRIYARPLTTDELARGAATCEGPAPGQMDDHPRQDCRHRAGLHDPRRKRRRLVHLDGRQGQPRRRHRRERGRVADLLGARLQPGRNPSDQVAPANVVIGDKVTIPAHGKRRRFTAGDLNAVFARSHRGADGSYRAVAARGLPGRVIGGFKYYGTRPDDPNDVIPHEHRRELRALQVFGGWTNLVDMKAGNTLDTVITENGRSIVRHYLQDVGSTFGTGSLQRREDDDGHEYLYEGGPTAKRLFTIGFYVQPVADGDYEKVPEIGRFTADAFEPAEWKPRVPVGRCRASRPDDELWAALRVIAFSDEHIRAVVKTGQFTDAAAEKLLADILIKRRDTIGRFYTAKVNPLTKFALDGSGALTFENPAVRARYADAPKGGYTATFARFDNAARTTQPIGGAVTSATERIQAPSDVPRGSGSFLKVSVAAVDAAHAAWAKPVDVYFRATGSGWQLVGVERVPEGNAPNSVKPR